VKKKTTHKRKMHYTKFWKRLVILSIIFMFVTIVLDLFYRPQLEAKGIGMYVDLIDVPITLILLADVGLKFNDAKDKFKFVRHNMVLIFSVLPISIAFMGFRLFRVFPALTELPLLAELASFERILKLQHGAKFIEGVKKLFRFR